MKTLINNETQKIQVSEQTFNAFNAMHSNKVGDFCTLKDVNNNSHIVFVGDNFDYKLNCVMES